MKRAILLLLIATTASAAERSPKRQLIAELLQTIDARTQLRATFDLAAAAMFPAFDSGVVPDPEAQAKARQLQDRVYARIDYEKLFDETYAPLIDARFSEDELRALIQFLRTKPGQKFAALQTQLALNAASMEAIRAASNAVQQELDDEDRVRRPWRRTIDDITAIATAVESYIVDTDQYPNVAFEELPQKLAPTYILSVPQTDIWGTPYFYIDNGHSYRIVSAGADRRFEWTSRQLDGVVEPRPNREPGADIIFQDGLFVQSPEEEGEP